MEVLSFATSLNYLLLGIGALFKKRAHLFFFFFFNYGENVEMTGGHFNMA